MSAVRNAVLERLHKIGLAVGGVFLLALVAGFLIDRAQFFRSYLLGYLFWVEMAVGSLGLAMLSQLTGGLWGIPVRDRADDWLIIWEHDGTEIIRVRYLGADPFA